MIIEKIEVALVMPKELVPGHRIINVGIVMSVEEWNNCYKVGIYGNDPFIIQNPKYRSVNVLAENGSPKIIEYTY